MHPTEIVNDYKVLRVSSSVFEKNSMIPRRYTCDDLNINPPLEIQGIPNTAKSLVLLVEDPDAQKGTWLHWLVWNIPVTHHISEGKIPGEQGLNDFGRTSYGGPCPPSGTHRYLFKIYALDTLLPLQEGASRHEVEVAMRDHIIAFGEQIGRYKKHSPD